MDNKVCEFCWKEFKPKRNSVKFCSRECYYNSKKPAQSKCIVCWKMFVWLRSSQQYCSMECYLKNTSLDVVEKQCPTCWKKFTTKNKDKIYCNGYCRNHQNKICEICWEEFITNSYNQRACNNCTNALKKKWRDTPRLIICKYCWEKFEWAYMNNTCKKCIKKLCSTQAEKLKEKYNLLPEDEKQKRRDKIRDGMKSAIDNIDKNKWDEWQNKRREWLKRYYDNMSGEEYNNYHNNLIEKAKERYKRTWYMRPVQQPSVIAAIKNQSKEEKKWKDFFMKEWYEVWVQFSIWVYRYDLKIWNTLIEVNPFPFHNSTFAPKVKDAKPKTKIYHYDKTKYAIDNWYNIINIRDWMSEKEVLSLLDKTTAIKSMPVLHRYNPKTKKHLIDEWFCIEDMLSQWFIEIRDWGEFYFINN